MSRRKLGGRLFILIRRFKHVTLVKCQFFGTHELKEFLVELEDVSVQSHVVLRDHVRIETLFENEVAHELLSHQLSV